MGVPARAAVEAPEGERASEMARSRAADELREFAYTCLRYLSRRRRLLMLRGKWLALRLSALRLPLGATMIL
jgi:hypothetical protein